MKLSSYNYNLSAYYNIKSNLMADRMAKNRWGNKFKRLFLRHIESIYTDYPAYNFKEGMKDCTNTDGSTQDRLDEAISFRDSLNSIGEGLFSVKVRNSSHRYKIRTVYDITIDSVNFSDDSVSFDIDLKHWLEELILEKNLFDFGEHPIVGSVATLDIDILVVVSYLDETIAELQSYTTNHSRANDDLELINHLGLCSTLADEISKPHKIKSIYFRFKKEVNPPKLRDDDGIFIGYDETYDWWNEEQFDEIRKNVKGFKSYCTFVVGVDDGSTTGAYTQSYVYVHATIFNLSGYKIYWFVKAFLDIAVRSKKNWFSQIFGVLLLVVGIYLTAISANPAWMKVVMIIGAIATYSGALSPKAQLVLMVVMFAYGAYNSNLSAMSNMQIFQWAIKNIEMVLNMVQQYEYIQNSNDSEDSGKVHEVQDRAMRFIYSDAYSQYDNFYSVMYDYEPKYKKG